MNEVIDIYDFDKTVYDGDSSLDFYLFCIRKKPWLIVYAPYQVMHAVFFAFRIESRTKFKSHFFVFLRGLKNPEKSVNDFWVDHYKKIKDWYLEQDHSKDVIISASPEFLLYPAYVRLKAKDLIATLMDAKTGTIQGENCRGEQKVIRLNQKIKNLKVRRVYTDHWADDPLLNLAKEKYLVKGQKIVQLK